jgi:hypothetical protein
VKPSSRDPGALPRPARLERLSMSLATLDAILSPEWEYRYYSFNKTWDAAKSHRMGSMRNGSGDDYFILFTPAGCAIKGYAHEYPMAHPGKPPAGMFDGFPKAITDFLTEPSFSIENTTFCLWCLADGAWTIGSQPFAERDDPDGSEFLLDLLAGDPRDYREYAKDYFEAEVPLASVKSIYEHRPLTPDLVHSLNANVELASLLGDMAEIGYPMP